MVVDPEPVTVGGFPDELVGDVTDGELPHAVASRQTIDPIANAENGRQ
jgi:hypothetical protein